MEKEIRGINILNPVDVDRDYYIRAVDFAIENGYNHIQLNGPIHDFKRSNVDGMVMYKKYSNFNYEKDEKYVSYCMDVVNECLEKSHKAGIKTFMWHHELDVPADFVKTYPEILNDSGDVEITHPLIKDFTENKLKDFFEAYPLMDGIVITFYESKIPLFKLKNQKLTPYERLDYVSRILYDTCKRYGKELIVRVDATTDEEYRGLLDIYENISRDMLIMEKWTQYDWSLVFPSNEFMKKIQKNPLLVETDIFGEYFGKGMLPMMLKKHIIEKVDFCEKLNTKGYCNRIDRGGRHSFGQLNEVNLHIMKALLEGSDVEAVVSEFFNKNYGEAGASLKEAMESTEDILRKMLFAGGYYYSELSLFPSLNHAKNHFYFEQMASECNIVSPEWFIPEGYVRESVQKIFDDLLSAREDAESALAIIESVKDKMPKEKYEGVYTSFKNLELAARAWVELGNVYFNYTKFFETKDASHEEKLYSALAELEKIDREGISDLGEKFHAHSNEVHGKVVENLDRIAVFVSELKESFTYEKRTALEIEEGNPIDYVIAGGGNEAHALKKETNFSDTININGEFVRIPGNMQGMAWSFITAHGFFSYELSVKKNAKNLIRIVLGSNTDRLNFKLTIGGEEFIIDEKISGKHVIEKGIFVKDQEKIEVRVDKISGHVPCVYTIATY